MGRRGPAVVLLLGVAACALLSRVAAVYTADGDDPLKAKKPVTLDHKAQCVACHATIAEIVRKVRDGRKRFGAPLCVGTPQFVGMPETPCTACCADRVCLWAPWLTHDSRCTPWCGRRVCSVGVARPALRRCDHAGAAPTTAASAAP